MSGLRSSLKKDMVSPDHVRALVAQQEATLAAVQLRLAAAEYRQAYGPESLRHVVRGIARDFLTGPELLCLRADLDAAAPE